jgi:hypothetical protein
MKTQILQLDEHDDVISTRDKMNWGQTGRILLVWPESGRLLRRRVDLVVLQRHSAALGAQLALVTTDPVVRFHARSLAIPIFKSLRQAQSVHWRVERRKRIRQKQSEFDHSPRPYEELEALRLVAHPPEPPWISRPTVRVGIFTVGVLAVLALAAVLLPGAEIRLIPLTKPQDLHFTIRASASQNNLNLAGIVPARPITVIVEGRDSLEASGTTRVPDQPATGDIVFTNLSDMPVRIPAGLVVRSLDDPPLRFATLQAGEIESGPGVTTTLAVRALTPGIAGNLPTSSLTAIEGGLGLSLAATNPEPTRGGTSREVPTPTDRDRDRLYQSLETSLRATALEELHSQVPAGDMLFTQTLTITQVLDVAYTPADEVPSGQLLLNLRLEYQVLSASRQDIETLANVLLDANLPEGFHALEDTLILEETAPPKLESPTVAQWEVSAKRNVEASIPAIQVINLVLGSPPDSARARLKEAFPLEGQPMIRLTPSWWPRLPILPFRITLVL